MSVDLHIHTTASDGTTPPEEVINLAVKAGLSTIAFADHETTEGYFKVLDICKEKNIEIIPGIELLTYYKETEIHLLGYFMDVNDHSFQEKIRELRNARTECAYSTVEKLNYYGINIKWHQVQETSTLGGPISKGHIMQAIYNAGYIKSKEDSMYILKKYINNHGLAYTCYKYPFAQGVELIKQAGGIPVLAHPGLIGNDNLIPELLDFGVQGMEVFYYYFNHNREELINKYLRIAQKYNLLITGGSDYHGTYAPVTLGTTDVPKYIIQPLLEHKKRIT